MLMEVVWWTASALDDAEVEVKMVVGSRKLGSEDFGGEIDGFISDGECISHSDSDESSSEIALDIPAMRRAALCSDLNISEESGSGGNKGAENPRSDLSLEVFESREE